MPIVVFVPWLAFGLAFVIAQSRFYAAYLERYGGPDRHERSRMFWTRPVDYLRLLRKPPFTLASMFRRVDDVLVEQRRQHYVLAAIGAFGYPAALFVGLIIYGTLIVW